MEKRIVDKMVEAFGLKDNDVALLNFWGTQEEIRDLDMFRESLDNMGIRHIDTCYTDELIMDLVDRYPEGIVDQWFEEYAAATVVVDIMNRPAGMPPVNLGRDKYPALSKVFGSLFGFMSQHEKMIQITMPTDTNAMLAGADPEEYKARTIRALDIDYGKLKADCESKIAGMTGDRREIRTGKDCVLVMETTGREWLVDAGEGSFPCGEIYIAPVEERTNGKIFFETFALENGEVFNNVTLTIKDGKLVASDCQEFTELLASVGEEGADVVAELGIGMNPNVAGIEGDSSLDENAMGTFHIAFGMNFMFGGKNRCRFHMDFVTIGEIL